MMRARTRRVASCSHVRQHSISACLAGRRRPVDISGQRQDWQRAAGVPAVHAIDDGLVFVYAIAVEVLLQHPQLAAPCAPHVPEQSMTRQSCATWALLLQRLCGASLCANYVVLLASQHKPGPQSYCCVLCPACSRPSICRQAYAVKGCMGR